MQQAQFVMPFPDFDYEGWAEQLGLTVISKLFRPNNNVVDLMVQGRQEQIDQFSADLGWSPAIIYPV